MNGITHIPTQYPRHIPSLQPKMPQLMMSLMMNYMQDKYATTRQKKDWDRRDKEAEAQRKFDREKLTAEGKLGKLKFEADMRKDHIKLAGPEITPELKAKGYEQGDVIAGLNSDNWWVKRRDKKPKTFYKITDQGVVEAKATYAGDIENLKEQDFKRGDMTLKDAPETWGEPKWNKKLNALTIRSNEGNMKVFGKKGWVPLTKQDKIDVSKAGAPSITQIVGQEKFELQKAMTVGDLRTTLATGKQDHAVFGAQSPQFNNMNKQNEVAYWDTSKFDNKTKIKKLSKEAIDAGWTPKEVQEKADVSGMTIEQVLKEIGELPK